MRSARIVERLPLMYDEGAHAATDRPAYVRAASALAWFGGQLVIAQDDTSFLATIDIKTKRVGFVALPAGEGGVRQFDKIRGNKLSKMDLESSVVLPGPGGTEVYVAFGSGSTPVRELAVVWAKGEGPRVVPLPAFYAALANAPSFAAGELNLEGAVKHGSRVVFAHRGNGKGTLAQNACATVDASALLAHVLAPETAPVPALEDVRLVDAGSTNGVRNTVTDLFVFQAEVAFVAAAEASPDTIDDGEVHGIVIGWLRNPSARCMVVEADGTPYTGKIEGIVGVGDRVYACIDADDPTRPSELLTIALEP